MSKEELPPKTVKAQLVRLDDNLKKIERTQFAGLQRAPGSLPVLEAFQLFLENERKIAQRKLFVATAVALFFIFIALMVSGLYIRMALRRAENLTDELTVTAAGLENNLGTISQRQRQAEDALRQAARRMAAQQREIQEQAQRLEQQQLAATETRQEQTSEVIRLREQLETLLTDQESIRRMLGTTRMPAARFGAGAAPEMFTTIGPGRRREEIEHARPTEINYTTVTLRTADNAGVRWMLPIARE